MTTVYAIEPSSVSMRLADALVTLPGEDNLRFVRAGALAGSGAIDAAIAELRALVAEQPTWEVIIRSFAAKGFMNLPDGVSSDALLG